MTRPDSVRDALTRVREALPLLDTGSLASVILNARASGVDPTALARSLLWSMGEDMGTLMLTSQERAALRDKLDRLLREVSAGVDVWLAPGGRLDVLDKDAGSECFLDYDEPAYPVLAAVLAKLDGPGDDWRTMDSAPRDGTPILACCPRPAFWKPSRRPSEKWYYAVTWWRRPEDKAGFVGWGEFNMESWPPMHWRPVEPPPSS